MKPEPGPHDAPGPHYVSYDSSFGNFGPLPVDDNAYATWAVSIPAAILAVLLTYDVAACLGSGIRKGGSTLAFGYRGLWRR